MEFGEVVFNNGDVTVEFRGATDASAPFHAPTIAFYVSSQQRSLDDGILEDWRHEGLQETSNSWGSTHGKVIRTVDDPLATPQKVARKVINVLERHYARAPA